MQSNVGGQEVTTVLSGHEEAIDAAGGTPAGAVPVRPDSMEKLKTYLRYLWEDIRYRNWGAIGSSIRYMAFRKTPRRSCLVRCVQGVFFCRGGTTDFMYAHYAYEFRVKEFIREHAAGFHVYLDIGSCIGDYSVWLAGRGLRCHAFEPVPENFAVLKKNVLLNRQEERISFWNFGLGQENRKVRFHVRADNKGASALDRNSTGEDGDIEIRRLDDVASTLGIRPGERVLIKMDVEGMELDVLEGGREFLRGLSDVIIISEVTLSARDALIAVLDRIGGFVYVDVDSQNFAAIKTSGASPEA